MKSNTVIVIWPTVGMFILLIVFYKFTNISRDIITLIFWLMLGYMFLGTAIAQNRSGYFWKNLRQGNRGKTKKGNPILFIASNIFYSIIGLFIWVIGIIQYIWSVSA